MILNPYGKYSYQQDHDSQHEKHPGVHEDPQVETHDSTLLDNPQFQHYEETSNIQLFFDLFFVANLTSFTNSHEINSTTSIPLPDPSPHSLS